MAIKPITETLLKIAGGELVAKASEQLNEVVNAVDNLGGSGTVTIKLTIKQTKAGVVMVNGKSTFTKPENPMDSLMFVTPEGNLEDENPNNRVTDVKVIEDKGSLISLVPVQEKEAVSIY